jgi:hypothetical protein
LNLLQAFDECRQVGKGRAHSSFVVRPANVQRDALRDNRHGCPAISLDQLPRHRHRAGKFRAIRRKSHIEHDLPVRPDAPEDSLHHISTSAVWNQWSYRRSNALVGSLGHLQ